MTNPPNNISSSSPADNAQGKETWILTFTRQAEIQIGRILPRRISASSTRQDRVVGSPAEAVRRAGFGRLGISQHAAHALHALVTRLLDPLAVDDIGRGSVGEAAADGVASRDENR